MKQFRILLTFVFITAISYAQNVKVTYSLIIKAEKGFFDQGGSYLDRAMNHLVTNGNNLSFSLLIDSKGSFFTDNPVITADSEEQSFNNTALAFASYHGNTYNMGTEIIRQSRVAGNGVYVKQDYIKDWTLQNESKYIDKYLCYKATATKVIVNDSGKVFQHPIVAWYCPEIPYQYGPNGYGNLPGLILELQVRNVVFGAKEITLRSKEKIDWKAIDKVKVISESELNALLLKARE